jgi:hypothetical protein
VFNDPVSCYMEGFISSKLHSLARMNLKMSVFRNPKKLKNVHMTAVKKMKKVLNQVKEHFHCVLSLSNCRRKMFQIRNPPGMMLNMEEVVDSQMKIVFYYVFLLLILESKS